MWSGVDTRVPHHLLFIMLLSKEERGGEIVDHMQHHPYPSK